MWKRKKGKGIKMAILSVNNIHILKSKSFKIPYIIHTLINWVFSS